MHKKCRPIVVAIVPNLSNVCQTSSCLCTYNLTYVTHGTRFSAVRCFVFFLFLFPIWLWIELSFTRLTFVAVPAAANNNNNGRKNLAEFAWVTNCSFHCVISKRICRLVSTQPTTTVSESCHIKEMHAFKPFVSAFVAKNVNSRKQKKKMVAPNSKWLNYVLAISTWDRVPAYRQLFYHGARICVCECIYQNTQDKRGSTVATELFSAWEEKH